MNTTIETASSNLSKLNANNKDIEERLLPSALDLVDSAKEQVVVAVEIEQEEVKRRGQLRCYIALLVLGILAVIGLILYFVFK